MKKLLATLLSMLMVLSLFAGCGAPAEADPTPAPTPAETPSAEPEVTVAPGTYSFTYVDVYGDETAFTVTLRDTGKVYVMYEGALGKATVNGDGWTDNGDATVTTEALSEALPVEWADADGKITWKADGETLTPAGYTAPTEFIAKPYTDPVNAAEAVGVYTFGYVNAYGATVPYILWLNADGSANIFMESSWVGTQEYVGASWVLNDDGTVTVSDMSYEGEPPKTAGNGAFWFADDTYESTWELDGGSCAPAGFDGTSVPMDRSGLTEGAIAALDAF